MSENVKAVKEKYEEYLKGIGGVKGVGFNSSIIVYVDYLTPQLAKMLPRTLEGVPIRFFETKGKIVPMGLLSVAPAHAIYGVRTDKYRPAPGGVSVGHPEVTAGTLTSRAIDKTDRKIVGAGNNHVVALDWGHLHVGKKGDPTLQPGPYDGGVEDGFGILKRWIPVRVDEPNLIDGAIFDSNQLADYILDLGKPMESIDPYPGMKVVGSGRTSGLQYSKVIDVNASIKVEGWGDCDFVNQVVMSPALMAPGDSGMWIGDADNWRSAVVGFAGSPTMSAGSPAKTFEQLLGIEIIPPTKPLSLWAIGGIIGTLFTTGLRLSAAPGREVGLAY